MMRSKIFAVLFFICLTIIGQNKKHVLLNNCTAHIGNGEVIENCYIAFNNGRIEIVGPVKGAKIYPASYDTVIELGGKHVYPALINCNNILGLQEAEAVRPSSDFNEVGNINPHVRSLIAYNTDSKILPTVKTNGVLYTQCTPRSGLVCGESSVLATDGWNWEDAVLKADDGIHINFPRSMQKNGWWAEPAPSGKNTKFDEDMLALNKFFEDAKAYCNNPKGTFENNLRFEAMRGIFDGSKNLYMHAEHAKDIIHAIDFAKKYSVKKPVLVGGKDSWKCTKLLRENNIPVMLSRLNDLPDLAEDDVDIIFRTPYLLQEDSILFCLQMEGDMEAMQSRNLPFIAGTAAAYGLTKEQALQAITLNAAKIIGIDKEVGTLQEGKVASIVVSEGDLLDMKTNKVVLAYINGRSINLTNEQFMLYQKYKNKYGIK